MASLETEKEEKMNEWSMLVHVYIFAMVATAMIATVCLIIRIVNSGGVVQYYGDRGVRRGYIGFFVGSILMIIFMTWVLTPAATVYCRDVWLYDRD